jgi:tetratricopeptide (TPR) repeat protein
MIALSILLVSLFAAPVPLSDSLTAILRQAMPDEVGAALLAYAARHPTGETGVNALMTLGRYDYARGEYRPAATAFARAAARLEPARKPEARYWAGLCWFALGDHDRARGALEEVTRAGGLKQAEAQLALAQVWEATGRSEKAIEHLDALLASEPGEVGATALAMQYEIAMAQHREPDADRAAERLLREYPNSMEASRFVQRVVAPPSAQGHIAVRIGAFSDEARARSLAAAARRAGFAEVRVIPPTGTGAPLYIVRLGPYGDPDQARKQAERVAELLGVIPELIQTP